MKNTLNILVDVKYHFVFKKYFEQIFDVFTKNMNYQNIIIVDVLITDNKKIKKISSKYRQINKETDVLSFPFQKDKTFDIGFIHLGEIVLSYEKIQEQAKKFNHSIKREFCYLFAHGLVHLSGKDHKKNIKEEQEFNKIVYKIMEKVKIYR